VRCALKEHVLKTAEGQQSNALISATKAAVFPGNYLTAVLEGQPVDASDTYERGVELAASRLTRPLAKVANHEVLLAGSWCLTVGVLLSLVLRRVHVLMLFGICLFAGVMVSNQAMPTTQYGVCALCALVEIRKGARSLRTPPDGVTEQSPREKRE